ncbi:TetR/AcrR family transcriptional regulator [Corynebacterium uberis]|uniref:TetR/AcrR family transcriptional regulator n=1 Tax=Corynebacterium TaxID=1716 RepID=UPI001D0A4472|nr:MULTISPECIES: TetR family transcriptional regulator [Corynebacterium]MCZ9309024.1 TetR family transcriptional regulator [Corynebacterium sp. c6VSa_13]UDL74509.1 TetR family transcriptional regulator [Corynebacterium uberis]UDL78869.1 TetR family transcriptional regulator [Corynebacterium uberis]UDL81147.1 TetR family transcriptional regulator [Corynebacterium uberis]UDL83285.1 TetR family transcriptional regulator [Corynebacterium uberis]
MALPPSSPPMKASARRDPDRRMRIVVAAMKVICTHGVAGTSHRRVAQAAGVPLGSMTYYFNGIDELLHEAFAHFTDESVAEFSAYFAHVDGLESAREAVVNMLVGSSESMSDSVVLGSELYAIAVRHPRFQAVLRGWIRRCRAVVAQYFDADTTLVIDALYEGLLLHRSMEIGDHPRELIATAIARLTPPQSYVGPGAANGG